MNQALMRKKSIVTTDLDMDLDTYNFYNKKSYRNIPNLGITNLDNFEFICTSMEVIENRFLG